MKVSLCWFHRNFKYKELLLSCLLATNLAFSPEVFSSECFSQSPSWNAANKVFTPVNPVKLEKREQKQILRFFNQIEGDWQGKAFTMECRGRHDSISIRNRHFDLNADIKSNSSGDLKIDAQFYNAETKSTRPEKLRLYLRGSYLRAVSPTKTGDIEPGKVSKNEINFTQKYRRQAGLQNGRKASLAHEIVTKISRHRSKLLIVQSWYVQGLLVSKTDWELSSH